MHNYTDDQIKIVKAKLRNYSSNFHDNFKNIENFIKIELKKMEKLKEGSKPIIPEIKFKDIINKDISSIDNILNRGCVIIIDVFEDSWINKLNEELNQYIEINNFYEDQKKKVRIR